MTETGFNHEYPARECPPLESPPGWGNGIAHAESDWHADRKPRNPYRAGSDDWRGYEYGVFLTETE